MPVTVQCAHCGIEVRKRPSNVRKHNFCDRACYHAYMRGANHWRWQGGKISQACEWCGSEFKTHRCQVKLGFGRFCSRACLAAWKAGVSSGENSVHWKGGPVTMVCEQCGKPYEVPRRIYNSRTPRYCSQKCMGEWRKEHWQREGHPIWQGLSDEPYAEDWTEELRARIRARDGNKCVICEAVEVDNGRRLSVHHIDYDKQNSRDANLISLCINHHMATNNNRTWWSYWLPRYSRGKYMIQ